MRRTIGTLVAGGLIATVAIIATLVVTDDDGATEVRSDEAAASEPVSTAVVARKDFVETTEVEGTLGFGAIEALPNQASGIVTWLPEAGAIVDFGDVLYEVDGRPVWLLEGDRPMFRTLSSRSSDGPDVLALESFLADGGFLDETLVDEDFTSSTAGAIEDWEESLGLEPTGTLALGTFIYRAEPFRIASVNATLGAQVNGGSVLGITATERLVSVALDTSLTGLLTEGQTVDVELPDASVVAGEVTFVSGVAVTDGQGPQASSYLDVEIVLEGSGGQFDESPVTVLVEEVLEADALVVPIASLLALAEGGYAVEVMHDGEPVLTGVELGTFLSNEVSIFGEVEPGDEVVVP